MTSVPPAIVLRLVRPIPKFLPEGALLPTWEAFAPSTDDKAEAAEGGHPVRVSVWDRDQTTADQAATIRGETTARPFDLPTLAVERLAEVRSRASLVRHPLVNDSRPGADGHCGIEGLDRESGENRAVWKSHLDRLAQACMGHRPAGET